MYNISCMECWFKPVAFLQSVVLYHPQVHNSLVSIKSTTILPSECRQRGETYKGLLLGKLAWWINGQQKDVLTIRLGDVPVMVKVR